jgi:drug/metabolite transporter (DMT)-like permease
VPSGGREEALGLSDGAMGAALVLWSSGPSAWTTYVAVGIGVAVLGALVLVYSITSAAPTPLISELAGFVVLLGLASAAAGFVLRWRDLKHPDPADLLPTP